MSLTKILNSRSDVKDWLKFNFPNPGLGVKKEILVPSKNPLSNSHNGEIGTAFDYLFRFNLERINTDTVLIKDEWIAEKAFNEIVSGLSYRRDKNIRIGYYLDTLVNRKGFLKFLEDEFEASKIVYSSFLKTGLLTKDLIRAALFLANLDIYCRVGIIDAKLADFAKIENNKINELEELFENVPWNEFKAKNHCILNPHFGEGTRLVRGADADLLIDHSLIDLKVVKHLKLDRIHLNQIIGYFLLSLIGDVNGKKGNYISDIGIYFGRHAHLWKMPISEYYSEEKTIALAKEFSLLIKEKAPLLEFKVISEKPSLLKHKAIKSLPGSRKIPLHVKANFDFNE